MMAPPAKADRPEAMTSARISTDKCLQTERIERDKKYTSAQKPIEDQSDTVVKKASRIAELVLETARHRAESRLEAAREEQREVVREERARADAIVRQERSAADSAHVEVQKARDRADQILKDARHLADTRLEQVGTNQAEIVAAERALAAKTRREEESTADVNLLQERGRRDILLAHLARMERSQTDQKLLVERARADHAVMTRDEFMGMVSHDIRSMLSTITLSAGMLSESASEDEVGKRVSRRAIMIDDAAARIDRLVGDLVDIASIELGNLSVLPRPQDAVAVLTDVVDAFRAAALKKGISLEAEPVEGEVSAEFDRDRILQVLGNFVSNAVKFSNPGGTIVIRLEPSADGICFSVRDNGAGIRGDQLESVFERFWQGTENDRRGIGLGLFISKCLIDAHGGRVWATSKLGAGSTFYFTLPAGPNAGPLLH